MALTVSTLTSNVTAPVNFVLMRGLLSAARKRLPYYNGTIPGKLEKNGGSMSVKWRRIENLSPATTALGEITGTAAFGLGRNTVQPTVTDLTVAIAKYGNAILTTEELDLFNVNSRTAQLLDVLGANAGESINILMRDVYDGGTNIRRATAAAADTSITAAISLNDIKYTVNQLDRNSAMKFYSQGTGSRNIGTSPIRESYMGICHTDVESDIRGLTGFIPVEQYAGYTDTFTGEFGTVWGVRWCSTPTAPISTGAGTTTASGLRGASAILNDVYATFIYGKEAIGSVGLGENHTKEIYMMGDRLPAIELIQKKPGSSGIGDMYNEVGSIAWKTWFAGKILNNDWLYEVRTGASNLT